MFTISARLLVRLAAVGRGDPQAAAMGRSPLFPQDIDSTIRGSSEMSSSSNRAGRR
jgi:hypothetical protein